MIILSSWTRNNSPAVGLTPNIRIIDANTDTLVVNNPMSEFTSMLGTYYYNFTSYSSSVDYAIRCDSGDSTVDARYTYATGSNELFLASTIWNVNSSAFTIGDNTFGGLLKFLAAMEGGRWRLDGNRNQMIFYDDDNSTEIARFNLFDINGQPTICEVTERRRV